MFRRYSFMDVDGLPCTCYRCLPHYCLQFSPSLSQNRLFAVAVNTTERVQTTLPKVRQRPRFYILRALNRYTPREAAISWCSPTARGSGMILASLPEKATILEIIRLESSHPIALSRSAIKSAAVSKPIDKRITSDPAPAASRCSSLS